MDCKNCGHTLEGKFCSNCGQNARVKRINYRYLLNEIPNSVFQIGYGFFYTVKELIIRPGHSLRDFMEGKRKNHFKPLAFLLLASTISIFLNYLLGNKAAIDDVVLRQHAENENGLAPLYWIFQNQSYFLLCVMPFQALASYLAFIKWKYNYFEHFVLNVYIAGQITLLNLLFSFTYGWNESLSLAPITLGIVYLFWVYMQFFNQKKFFKKLLLILLNYLILLVLIFVLVLFMIYLNYNG